MEHIFLLKAKEDLSDEEEKDMLDYLYTAQYLMGGIVAISLGEIFISIQIHAHTLVISILYTLLNSKIQYERRSLFTFCV